MCVYVCVCEETSLTGHPELCYPRAPSITFYSSSSLVAHSTTFPSWLKPPLLYPYPKPKASAANSLASNQFESLDSFSTITGGLTTTNDHRRRHMKGPNTFLFASFIGIVLILLGENGHCVIMTRLSVIPNR